MKLLRGLKLPALGRHAHPDQIDTETGEKFHPIGARIACGYTPRSLYAPDAKARGPAACMRFVHDVRLALWINRFDGAVNRRLNIN